jgi:REP element-mobilizing transposase RayT
MDMPLRSGHQALRTGPVGLRGQLYHLTAVTRGRRRVFQGFEAATAACRAIHVHARGSELDALCWVLMPDQLHLLARLQCDDLSAAVGHLKARVAHEVNEACGSVPPVWGRGFHDHALRSDENALVVARYIVAHPLRAGLVGSMRFYPYWYAGWL